MQNFSFFFFTFSKDCLIRSIPYIILTPCPYSFTGLFLAPSKKKKDFYVGVCHWCEVAAAFHPGHACPYVQLALGFGILGVNKGVKPTNQAPFSALCYALVTNR